MTNLGKILDIGKECGLETCGEAILNMELHYGVFSVDEYNKVIEEYNALYKDGLISYDTRIEDMKMLMN